ncbi:A/G-specific adenine glycosylase [Paenibacillus humicola]|uniref:A/G-specific adenine glycosylase n=1 Tax=Paenibacillus humicola TaxID=3110540 RepID=UPI00237C2A49|nr:A/G-specific adenine glycosylase [Paenibacillus humicola]
MTTEAAGYFSRELLGWYLENKRDLPWRQNRDPYRIWVSEVMLQQTRVDTVIPYYERFMNKFPTVAALAAAPEDEVLKCWEGLGYYSRARNLQAGAREVVERHGGIIPGDKQAVSALRGIGPYTAGAVLSIAFNEPEPAVDGNVMRVLSRYFCLEDDIAKPSTRAGLERLAASLIPEGAACDFNQALMELGALVCTPKSPGCLTCPVVAHCEGRAAGREHELPVKTKAKPPRPETRLAALVAGSGAYAGCVLVRQRADSGLLARMWELPHVADPQGAGGEAAPKRRGRRAASAGAGAAAGWDGGDAFAAAAAERAGEPPQRIRAAQMDALCRQLAAEDGLLVRPTGWWGETEHTFSHIVWSVQVFEAEFGFVLEQAAALDAPESPAAPGIYPAGGAPVGAMLAAEAPVGYQAGDSGALRGHDLADTSRPGHSPSPTLTDGTAARDRMDAGIPLASDNAVAQRLPRGYRWIGPEHMRELAFPNVFLRILRDYWDGRY